MSALNEQVSGSHYKDKVIQPVEYIYMNNIGYMEGNVIKYISRWEDKGGINDLLKAKHYIELLIELQTKKKEMDGQKDIAEFFQEHAPQTYQAYKAQTA
jgi:hypothetical protein